MRVRKGLGRWAMRHRSAEARSTRVGLARVGGKVRLSVSFLPGGSTPLQRKGTRVSARVTETFPSGAYFHFVARENAWVRVE